MEDINKKPYGGRSQADVVGRARVGAVPIIELRPNESGMPLRRL